MASLMRAPSVFDANFDPILEPSEIADGNAFSRAEAGQYGNVVAAGGSDADGAPFDGVAVHDEDGAGVAGHLQCIARQVHTGRRLAARLLSRVGQKRDTYAHLGQYARVLLIERNAHRYGALAAVGGRDHRKTVRGDRPAR